ncbi:hypothetical protein J1N35_029110 [Gossypium stocksii]|uniref:Uncharacterized protein n=1 Tax=Gossypium stocksii TaxID=47602 RepID=A0A9D3UXJ9_9ROSI|nr:hypothetical protein J1N35_029110 [Gossypium stocksii]
MKHQISNYLRRAFFVCDQPIVTAAAPTPARGKGRGRGDGGRGAGQQCVVQDGDGGPTRVYAVRELRTREPTDVIIKGNEKLKGEKNRNKWENKGLAKQDG